MGLPSSGGGSLSLVDQESKVQTRPTGWSLESAFALLALALPPALFYGLLSRTTLNLPILDDYNAVLDFLNRWIDCRNWTEKLLWFLSSQLVDVKPFFVRAVALVQYLLLGHVDFRLLTVCSVGLISLLALLLWKMFIPACSNRTLRLVLFLPVSFLLFELQYMTELNVVTTGMQHIAGVLFSFLAIYLLNQNTLRSFTGSCAALVLAIASDGNGFMVIAVGLLILFRTRRFRHAIVFAGISILCVVAYAFHYHRVVATGAIAHPPLYTRLFYVLGFIGSAAGLNYHFLAGGLVLGTLLVAFFVWKVVKGDARRKPLLYDCALFMLLTAVVASSGRSGFGLGQSLAGRYTLYSLVCVCLFWMVMVEDSLVHHPSPLGSGLFLGMLICSAVYSLCWDLTGYSIIHQRNQGLIAAIVSFEHPSGADPNPIPVPKYRFPGPNGVEEGLKLCQDLRTIMNRSIELGIYRPQF